MHKDAVLEELRQVERIVVEAEKQLAVQEALVVSLRRQNQDPRGAEAVLQMMRQDQQRREQDRQRLLSLLQP
jgi:hypothetical protein